MNDDPAPRSKAPTAARASADEAVPSGKAAAAPRKTARRVAEPSAARTYNPSTVPDFHREEFPFYWVARVNGMYALQLEEALKVVGCDIPTWRILAILHEQGTSSVSHIATHAIAKLSTVTRIVYRMKEDGLVSTATAAHDGRVTEVALTAAGEHAMQRVKDATSQLFARSFRGLTPGQIRKLNELLETIFHNLDG